MWQGTMGFDAKFLFLKALDVVLKKKKEKKKVLILAVLKDILISWAAEQRDPLIPKNGISLPDPRYILLQLGSVCP